MQPPRRETLSPEVLTALEKIRLGRRRIGFVAASLPILALLSLVPYAIVVTGPAFVIGAFALVLLVIDAHSTPCPCCDKSTSYKVEGLWQSTSFGAVCVTCGVKIDQRDV